MTFFCYVESAILSVPHMEPLAATDPEEALSEAQALLAHHASGLSAHVFLGDLRIGSIVRQAGDEVCIRLGVRSKDAGKPIRNDPAEGAFPSARQSGRTDS